MANKYKLKRNYLALGKHLQDARKRACFTQNQIKKMLGYSSAQFISNFERGIAAPPPVKLKKLIKLYRLDKEETVSLLMEGKWAVIWELLS